MKFTKAKAIVGAIGLFVTVLSGVFADDVLNTEEVGSLVSAGIAAVITLWGIYRVPNKVIEQTSSDEYSRF